MEEPTASTSKAPRKPAVPKKRKSTASSAQDGTDEDGGSPGGGATNGNGKAKKPKIPRACDTCRRKKIRCNPIPDSEPAICTYCSKHSLDCTWFLPISETRFKKQREKEEQEKQTVDAAKAAVDLPTATSSATLARRDKIQKQKQHQPSPPLPTSAPPVSHIPTFTHPQPEPSTSQHPYLSSHVQPPPSNYAQPQPQPQAQAHYPLPQPPSSTFHATSAIRSDRYHSPQMPSPGSDPSGNTPTSFPHSSTNAYPRKEPRIVGYTSISHLMHSTSTFPTERIIPLDFKYSQTLSVDERGDGFIRVISAGDGEPSGDGAPVAIQGIEHSDAEKLLNYFFTTHATHFPIVSRADFLGTERPTALLFNCICAVSALSSCCSRHSSNSQIFYPFAPSIGRYSRQFEYTKHSSPVALRFHGRK